MTGDIQARNEMFSAMYGGTPLKTYKKMILGRVFLTVWDNFNETPVGIILSGDPNKNDPECYFHIWSEKDDIFFKNAPHNREHLKSGRVIEVPVQEQKPQEKTIEMSSDEDIEKIVNSKFLALQNTLNKTDSEAVLFRMLTKAHELEKSDKIVKAIEARLAEVQELEFRPKNIIVEE